jgi:hypothetical protein
MNKINLQNVQFLMRNNFRKYPLKQDNIRTYINSRTFKALTFCFQIQVLSRICKFCTNPVIFITNLLQIINLQIRQLFFVLPSCAEAFSNFPKMFLHFLSLHCYYILNKKKWSFYYDTHDAISQQITFTIQSFNTPV